jgi:hypothetical protein
VNAWLESELRDAESVLDNYMAEVRALGLDIEESPTIRYWVGYVDAINNALNELSGMTTEDN